MSTTDDIVKQAEKRLIELRAEEKQIQRSLEDMLAPLRSERRTLEAIVSLAKPKAVSAMFSDRLAIEHFDRTFGSHLKGFPW